MRKKLKDAKTKRVKAMLVSAIMGMTIPIISVFGSTSVSKDYNYGYNINAYLHVYLDFLEGPLLFKDKVWCNIGIYGSEGACTGTIYDLGTDEEDIVIGKPLSYKNMSDSYTETKAGYGGNYAYASATYGINSFFLMTK